MTIELVNVTEVEQPEPTQIRIVWLRDQVAQLTAQIGDLETTAARYREAQAAALVQLDSANPDTADWAELAQVGVKVATYDRACGRIRSDLAPLRNKLDVMTTHLADEEGRIAQAESFVKKAHDIGLAAFPNFSIRDFQTEYARAIGRLAAAGIVVDRQDIAAGSPRWPGQNVAI